MKNTSMLRTSTEVSVDSSTPSRLEKTRLKVCMLAACPFPANHGTPGSIREMAEALVEQGHEIHIVTYHIGEDIPVRGPHIHRVSPLTGESSVVVGPTVQRPLYDLQMIFKTLKLVRKQHFDLIHAHGYEAAMIAWVCRLFTKLPVVYSAHNTMSDELSSYDFIRPKWLAEKLGNVLDRLVPRLANSCIPHSKNLEKFLHERGLKKRTKEVVNFGINLDDISQSEAVEVRQRYGLGDGPLILYIGVMNEFQRLDLLLEAMTVVLRSEPSAKLLIVVTITNKKQVERLLQQAQELGVSDSVVLTEPQPLQSIPGFIKACDVATVPRPQIPGFPIKMINYMAAGKPCVLFANSADYLTHRQDAILVTPDTGEAFGEAILEICRDPELRERLSRNAYRYVRKHHDRRGTALAVTRAYMGTLELCRRSPRLPRERQQQG